MQHASAVNEGVDASSAVSHRCFLGRWQGGASPIDFDAGLHVAYLKKFNIRIDLTTEYAYLAISINCQIHRTWRLKWAYRNFLEFGLGNVY